MKVVVLLGLSTAALIVLPCTIQGAAFRWATSSNRTYVQADTYQLALPTVTVVDSDGNAAESGSNTGSFRVSRTGSTASALTVRYSLGGSAANGADYATLPGNVTIPAGSVSATIIVDTIDDSVAEGDESVVLTLSADPAYVIGSPNSATVDMEDDDREPLPVLGISLAAGQTNDQVLLTWNSEAGRSYQVQYKSGWNATNWTNLAGVITATNSTATTSDFISLDRQRFYRLVLIP